MKVMKLPERGHIVCFQHCVYRVLRAGMKFLGAKGFLHYEEDLQNYESGNQS